MAADERRALAGEWWAAAELSRLLSDPVYYGVGVPSGDGRPVLVLPGLFGNDLYLRPLRGWLARIGYRPHRSGLLVNAGCPERLSRDVETVARPLAEAHPGRVALVGHSRGGILGHVLASRLGDAISHLILLGSPVGALVQAARAGASMLGPSAAAPPPAAPQVAEASTLARRLLDPECTFPECGCAFVTDLARPLAPGTRVVSIYTRDDRVVRPAACPVPEARNLEIGGTHSGLVYNRDVYREVAAALAAG